MLDENKTAHKAHYGGLVGALATFISLGIFFFQGLGEMPSPEEIALAIVTVGGSGYAVWQTVYLVVNHDKPMKDKSTRRHYMLPLTFVIAAGLLASACENGFDAKKAFPRTYQGYEEGGVVGAVEGFTEGVLIICTLLNGDEYGVAVDAAAVEYSVEPTVDKLREFRINVCRKAAVTYALANLVTNPVVDVEVGPLPMAKPTEIVPDA